MTLGFVIHIVLSLFHLSDQPQPPIEETRAGVNSSTCVGLSVVQSDTNSEPL